MLDYSEFALERLLDAKSTRTMSVCIPARDEANTVGGVVGAVLAASLSGRPLADEVIVVDDHSVDGTAEAARAAGAKVIAASTDSLRRGPGKGSAMRIGLEASTGDLLVFLDADVTNVGPHYVTGIVGPLLFDDSIKLVKASYNRHLNGVAGEGGRVTELTAKPLIRVLAPELGFLDQPLSGECSAPRYVLEKVFASARSGGSWEGYGIEMEILLAVAEMYGAESIAQVDLGNRIHRNRPLAELTGIANAVVDVLLSERIEKVRNRFLDTP